MLHVDYAYALHALTRGGVVVLLLMFCLSPSTSVAQDQQINRCTLEAGPRATVIKVDDSETLRLADGSTVRLLGTLGPRAPLSLQGAARWRPEDLARDALRTLTLGQSVSLAFDQRKRDRYGRLLAHVFVWHSGQKFWVQGELLTHGHVRAAVLPGTTACTHELLAHEAVARSERKGIWQHRYYRILKPEPARWLLAKRRHRFEIIEGVVRDVAVVKSKIYLNFGDNWRQDFTAALPKKAVKNDKAAINRIVALKGRLVRVRGWIERNNGPFIKLSHPDLIETLDKFEERPSRPDAAEPKLADSENANGFLNKRQLRIPRLLRHKKKRPVTPSSPSAQQL